MRRLVNKIVWRDRTHGPLLETVGLQQKGQKIGVAPVRQEPADLGAEQGCNVAHRWA